MPAELCGPDLFTFSIRSSSPTCQSMMVRPTRDQPVATAIVRARTKNSALAAREFPVTVTRCVVPTKRSLKATMMIHDLKLTPHAPGIPSANLATRTQHSAFRPRYAAAVAMAFVFSGLAPASLMALVWRETSVAPAVFALTLIIALTHAIGIGLPLFLICQLRGWVNLVSCIVLGAFIGILPALILAYPTELYGIIAGAWTGALTDPDRVIATAIWNGYVETLIYFGLLGALGGFVFWAVLKCCGALNGGRQNLWNNSLKAQAFTAPLPLCIVRKPPRLEQNFWIPLITGSCGHVGRATNGKDSTVAKGGSNA